MSTAQDYIRECLRDPRFFFSSALRIRVVNPETGSWSYEPFILNAEQEHLLQVIQDLEARKLPIRLIILKSRKLGCTTFFQALGTYYATFRPPWRVLTLVQQGAGNTEGPAREIGTIATDFVTQMPAAVRDLIGVKAANGGLTWPTGSSLRVASQRSEDFARGASPSMCLLSEVGLWDRKRASTSAEDTMQSVLSSMDRVPGTIGVIESTACGTIGSFPTRWALAQQPGSTWVPIFFPWHRSARHNPPQTGDEQATYKAVCDLLDSDRRGEAEDKLRAAGVPGEWVERACEHRLTLPQIRWATDKVDEMGGDLARFDAEYPLTPRHAFASTGRPVFSDSVLSDITTADYYLSSGPLVDEEDKFAHRTGRPPMDELVTPGGVWQFYEEPRADFADKYVVGMDTGGGAGGDYTVIQVLNRLTGAQAAEFRSNTILPEDAAVQASIVGWLYGYRRDACLLVHETNNHGHVVTTKLENLNYPSMYRERVTNNPGVNAYQRGWGFTTNAKSRPILLTSFATAIRTKKLKVKSDRTKAELRTWEFDSDGVIDHARGCHDDTLFALALAWHGHEYLGEVDPAPRVDTIDLRKVLGTRLVRFGPT